MSIKIAALVSEAGGKAYYVGGFVRDRILGIDTKDIDMEIHKLEPDKLEAILDSLGNRLSFGASFGINTLSGYDIDIALPRRETSCGSGHRDFIIKADPFIGTLEAARRRDFTVNALMEDILTGEIVDHFNGQHDLQQGILRHIDSRTFPEDPLRVLRGAQFAARFEFNAAPETVELCKKIDISGLARERVYDEVKKALLKAEKPLKFFTVLDSMNQMESWFPEIKAGEGRDNAVWSGFDMAASKSHLAEFAEGFMVTAMSFLGGSLQSGSALIERLTSEKKIISYVKSLRFCMEKLAELNNISQYEYNLIFDDCVSPGDLVLLYECFVSESGGAELRARLDEFLRIMEKPFVQGRDLMEMGFAPGVEFKELLQAAHDLRLKGVNKQTILDMVKRGSKRT